MLFERQNWNSESILYSCPMPPSLPPAGSEMNWLGHLSTSCYHGPGGWQRRSKWDGGAVRMKARDPKTPGGIESTGQVDSIERESEGGAKYYMFWSLGDWETQVIILLSRLLLPYPTPHLGHHVTVSLAPASLVLPSVLAFPTLLNLEREILSAHASFDPSEPCKTRFWWLCFGHLCWRWC